MVKKDGLPEKAREIPEPPVKPKSWRHRADGTNDNKLLRPDYFKTYYQTRLKQSNRECSECGELIYDFFKKSRHEKLKTCLQMRWLKDFDQQIEEGLRTVETQT